MTQEVPSPKHKSRRLWLLLKLFIVGLVAFVALVAGTLYWIFGTDTHHSDRGSIWWSERGRSLIPPAATDITLRQDLLDHYAISRRMSQMVLVNGQQVPREPERRVVHTAGWMPDSLRQRNSSLCTAPPTGC